VDCGAGGPPCGDLCDQPAGDSGRQERVADGGPETDIKILATGLGAGILVDATLIRCLLAPALVSLCGAYNWWLRTWAARLLRVEPSPLSIPQTTSAGTQATVEPEAVHA
jgi:RND superfamily putative drug exporter